MHSHKKSALGACTPGWSRLFAAALLAAGASASVQAQSYVFTDLGTFGGKVSVARDINNAGQVVGVSLDASANQYATLWDTAGAHKLGAAGSAASGINESGQVVGASNGSGALWGASGTYTNLGVLPGNNPNAFSEAMRISNTGQVIGYGATDQMRPDGTAYTTHAIAWNGGVATDLGTLGGSNSFAYGVNSAGTVVGTSNDAANAYGLAALWSNGSAQPLGEAFTAAYDINEQGRIAGYSFVDAVQRATIFQAGQAAIVLDPNGAQASVAQALNNVGQVVGKIGTRAVLWSDGQVIQLDDFLDAGLKASGWRIDSVTAINDNGWIVGTAFNGATFESRAYLLSTNAVAAVPEPQTWALMLAGLGVAGFAARRRR